MPCGCRIDPRRSTARTARRVSYGPCALRTCKALTQYRIEPRIRAHTSLTRDTLIPLIAACVPADEGHHVDLAHPDVILVVEVLRNVCGIGALHDYERWAKYNVQTLAERHRT